MLQYILSNWQKVFLAFWEYNLIWKTKDRPCGQASSQSIDSDVPHTWVGPRTHDEKWGKLCENKELDLMKVSSTKKYSPKTEAGDL